VPILHPHQGQFAEEKLRLTVDRVCARVGLDPCGARLIHVTINALFVLDEAGVVLRVAGDSALLPRVRRLVDIARWLEAADFPAVRLLPDVEQPVHVPQTGHLVTFWRYLPQTGEPARASDLAVPLRRFHALPSPNFPLPAWDPIGVARARIDAADHVDAGDRSWLKQLADQIEDQMPSVQWALPRTTIHGDAYIGNVLRDAAGNPVLCDFDAVALGPPEWDLIPELVAHIRFGRPAADYQRLVDDYGFDPRDWEGAPVLRLARELNVLTGVLPILPSSPGLTTEFHHRMQSLRHGDTTRPWTPFRKVA
jgi:hypothetical protein